MFCLIICFFFIYIILVVILWVMFILCVMIICVMFVFFNFLIIFIICVVIFGLSVVVGLLNNNICGCIINVWVIVICCCWLFESWSGKWLVNLFKCKCFKWVFVCVIVFFFDIFNIFIGVLIKFCSMVKWFYKWYCWNIIFILWCSSVICFVFILVDKLKLCFVIFSVFFWGIFNKFSVWISVFFFVLEGLSNIIILFFLILRLMLKRVWLLL